MPIPQTQGQRLRQRRLEKRLTQEYLAEQLNTTKQAIYKYEADIVQNIPLEKLLRLAQLLDCSPAWLQGFADEPLALAPVSAAQVRRLVIFNAIAPRMGRDHTIGARALSRVLTQPVGPSTP